MQTWRVAAEVGQVPCWGVVRQRQRGSKRRRSSLSWEQDLYCDFVFSSCFDEEAGVKPCWVQETEGGRLSGLLNEFLASQNQRTVFSWRILHVLPSDVEVRVEKGLLGVVAAGWLGLVRVEKGLLGVVAAGWWGLEV